MKVLLLGGTGAMGVHLAQILQQNGVEVYITSRSSTMSEDFHYFRGDAKDLSFLQTVLEDQSWNAIVDFMVYDTASFEERVDVLLNNTKQYVFLSSARVYTDSEQALNENTPRLLDVLEDVDYLATEEYALTKARQENVLQKSTHRNWTIIRPYITYGETRLQLGALEKEEWLYRALNGRTIIFSKEMMDKKTTLTYGYDVAVAIAKIIGKPEALTQVYQIASNENITWGDVLETYLLTLEKHLGYRPKVLLLELNDFLKCKNAHYQVYYDRLYNRIFDNDKIAKYVDVESFMSTKVGLTKCLEAFLQHPHFAYKDWPKEALKDRSAGECTPMKEISGMKPRVKYLLLRYGLI